MRYNGSRYFYVTNLQGDVIAILDANGNSVVQYTYDAWGKVLSITGSMADTIGTINPLLYRGYIYDHDTGLYYLQSRYYNPTIARFINADAFVSTGQGILGNNMFAYCANNPVNYIDPTGAAYCERKDSDLAFYGGWTLPTVPNLKSLVPPHSATATIGSLIGTFVGALITSIVSDLFCTPAVEDVEQDIGDIGQSYGLHHCREAAESIANYLRKNISLPNL